ncbi:MAG: helix-turn-helix domain-containing protein [Rhizobiaceae bacterium]|nr:helix-turn-helix domain-containing protein [Rhizobiaceae bacterium]
MAKGLAIIESFGRTHEYLTVSDAAQYADISRASARRCLLTLADLGYLTKSGSQFRPTPRMLRLGAAYYEASSLPQLAQTHLDNARDELRESIALAVFEDGYSVFIARSETERIVTSIAKIGQRLPAFASATGRVLLADYSDDDLKVYLEKADLVPFTKSTITDKKKLFTRIGKARTQQLEISAEELEEGLISMAVPVRNPNGETVAAMSMSASSVRISIAQMKRDYAPIIKKHADALSRTL